MTSDAGVPLHSCSAGFDVVPPPQGWGGITYSCSGLTSGVSQTYDVAAVGIANPHPISSVPSPPIGFPGRPSLVVPSPTLTSFPVGVSPSPLQALGHFVPPRVPGPTLLVVGGFSCLDSSYPSVRPRLGPSVTPGVTSPSPLFVWGGNCTYPPKPVHPAPVSLSIGGGVRPSTPRRPTGRVI